MEARVQPVLPCHFTMDLIVSLGGEDTHETRKMIEVLNGIMCIWGVEVNGYMETFLNLVKSKTDELARTLDTPAQQKGSTPSSGSETKKELENKIKALEAEKRDLGTKLKQAEASLTEFKNLRLLVKSYNTKCTEFDTMRYETGKNSIWYNEQMQSLYATKAELETTINKKNKKIQELESKLSSESLQVS
jgi:predicted RNase H-like nuclease (RuvC/YqgF family)